ELVPRVVGVDLRADLGAVAGRVVPVRRRGGSGGPRGEPVGQVVPVGVGGRAGEACGGLRGQVVVRVVPVGDGSHGGTGRGLRRVRLQPVHRVVVEGALVTTAAVRQ